jgi:tetratricopeptide (TPR) repeat protein
MLNSAQISFAAKAIPGIHDDEERIELIEGLIDIGTETDLSIYDPVTARIAAWLVFVLAATYNGRSAGNREVYSEQAIKACQLGLTFVTRDEFPTEWANTQIAMGNAYAKRLKGDKAENIEQAIVAYEAALTVYTREQFPAERAMTLANLATTYPLRTLGVPPENIEKIINYCEAALHFFTRDAAAGAWAKLHLVLAAALSDRIFGDRKENIERTINACHTALFIYTRESAPLDWVRLQYILAGAYKERVNGAPADNLERSIEALQATQTVYTRASFPEEWARTQLLVGAAYDLRIRGHRSANLEETIKAYRAALTVYTRESFSTLWAAAQFNLGDAYLKRMHGEHEENIEQAIKAYEASLTIYTRDGFPADWARTQHYLGRACGAAVRCDPAEYADKAIQAFIAALTVYKPADDDWASTQIDLGNGYLNRVHGERVENLERAIEAYQAVLGSEHAKNLNTWALIQSNLGRAYRERVRGKHAENVEQAINCCEAALGVYTREASPKDWVRTQLTLGNAFQNRVYGERSDNLERAIKAYEAALPVCEPDTWTWAGIQHEMGNAYGERIEGDRAENIERAIEACQAALTVYTRQAFPINWATSQQTLAAAYQGRSRGQRGDNIEKAIEAYQAALSVLTRESSPRSWAGLQSNLGSAYADRRLGERAENLENAIEAYQAALTVQTVDAFPIDWAGTRYNLAVTYNQRVAGEPADNLKQAIEACEDALQVYTPESFPLRHLKASHVLGRLYIRQRRWSLASEALASAREAYRFQFGQGLHEVDVQELLSVAASLFTTSAFVAAELRDSARAFRLLNDGKAQLMAVTLRLLDPKVPNAERQRASTLRRDIREWSRLAASEQGEDGAAALVRLAELRRELGEIVEAAHPPTPNISLPTDVESVILAPVITEYGSKLLIAKRNGEEVGVEQTELPGMTIETIHAEVEKWLSAYSNNYRAKKIRADLSKHQTDTVEYKLYFTQYMLATKQWLEAINELGPAMWKLIAEMTVRALKERKIERTVRIVWMPCGRLGILPISMAIDPETGDRFGDLYDISYAPSLEALGGTARRIAREPRLVAINPTNDLPATRFETTAIASHFSEDATITLSGQTETTPQTIMAALKDASYWHFATHASFDWQDPRQSALDVGGGQKLTVGMLAAAEDLARPSLVVLSACETGLYDLNETAAEFIGLSGAFTALGAAGVLATLWPVEDRATALLMAKFYDLHLGEERLPPATALQRAQAWLRQATRRELLVYVKTIGARTGTGELAIKLGYALQRGERGDARLFAISHVLKKIATKASPRSPRFRWLKWYKPSRMRERPFAHPYYWAGFVYTGH